MNRNIIPKQIGSTMNAVYFEPRHYNHTAGCMIPSAYAYIGPNGIKRMFADRGEAVDARDAEFKEAGLFDEHWHQDCDAA